MYANVVLCVVQFSVEDDLVPQMRACATHAFSAVLNKLNPMRRQHCFELFGLDFMVDARHKVPSYAVLPVDSYDVRCLLDVSSTLSIYLWPRPA